MDIDDVRGKSIVYLNGIVVARKGECGMKQVCTNMFFDDDFPGIDVAVAIKVG